MYLPHICGLIIPLLSAYLKLPQPPLHSLDPPPLVSLLCMQVSLLTAQPRIASVVALGNTICLSLTKEKFDLFVAKDSR